MEKGDGGPVEFEVPSGDFEVTTKIYVSAKEIDQLVDVDGVDGPDKAADFVADNDPSFQKTALFGPTRRPLSSSSISARHTWTASGSDGLRINDASEYFPKEVLS